MPTKYVRKETATKRSDLSMLTKGALMQFRMEGLSNADIAKKFGLNRLQVRQRCYRFGIPTQAELGQVEGQRCKRHWDTDEMFSLPEDMIDLAFGGRRFEDDPRALADGIGPRFRVPTHRSYVGCAAEMCAV